jgi:hypothetical protein
VVDARASKLHKRLHTRYTIDDEQVDLNEKSPRAGILQALYRTRTVDPLLTIQVLWRNARARQGLRRHETRANRENPRRSSDPRVDARGPADVHTTFAPSRPGRSRIELSFSIVQRKALTPNDFDSLETLAERLLSFSDRYRQIARPFDWTFTRTDPRPSPNTNRRPRARTQTRGMSTELADG